MTPQHIDPPAPEPWREATREDIQALQYAHDHPKTVEAIRKLAKKD